MNFRPCGDCNACCEGNLVGNAYGNRFGHGKPCVFLVNKTCSIHKTRPVSCQKYQCAWSQHLFSEWMKPTNSGVMISVETNFENNKQFLKVIELKPNIRFEVYQEIENFCRTNNTHYVKVGLVGKS
jgi:Fe-S-cluster containining protein